MDSSTRAVVMGLGEFGGGVGVTKWLIEKGVQVCVTDLQNERALEASIQLIGQHPNLTYSLGGHVNSDFMDIDFVVVNPSVPMSKANPFLDIATSTGARLTTEICLLVEQLPRSQVIGVTGSAGKSTTASMIHAAFKQSEVKSWLGGNIGGSLLNELSKIKSDDVVILELSSAMLWWLDQHDSGWSPHVSVLTNVSPNHIDWHGSFEEYERCKQVIFKHQTEDDVALKKCSDETVFNLSVMGKHNEQNAQFALAAAKAVGLDVDVAKVGIQSFKGLPHRLQRVSERAVNDSKSTTPEATQFAVDAFEHPERLRLIVGGYDKKNDLALLAAQSEKVACMYAIGETRHQIAELTKGNCKVLDSLEEAVAQAMLDMQEADVLLLSPGCASWDQFKNYEERGRQFIQYVQLLHCANK